MKKRLPAHCDSTKRPIEEQSLETLQMTDEFENEDRGEQTKEVEPGVKNQWFPLRVISLVLIAMVRVYQKAISPLLGSNCRFQPTCSQYFILAVQKYGPIIGTLKGVWRICRCTPFGGHGPDPP